MALDPCTGYVDTNKTRSQVTQCRRPLPAEAAPKNVSLPVLADKLLVQTLAVIWCETRTLLSEISASDYSR
jgi:hypothetical protein